MGTAKLCPKLLHAFYLLLFAVFFLAPFAASQVTANLSGIVTDQSSAAVTSAEVTVTNLDTGISRTASTDQTGRYHVFALPIGTYEVRVMKSGFAERKSTRLNSSHIPLSRMPSSA